MSGLDVETIVRVTGTAKEVVEWDLKHSPLMQNVYTRLLSNLKGTGETNHENSRKE